MFQFRRFPSYAYFVQRRMTGYCPAGLPHSEIPGSMDICSSPRLFAACHVLLRLLMPRHSPCALSSLTCSSQSPLRFVSAGCLSASVENSARSLAPRFSPKTGFRRVKTGVTEALSGLAPRCQRILVLFENYAGFSQIRNCMSPCILSDAVPHSICFVMCLHTTPLCCLTCFVTLFSFQGAGLQPLFAVRFEDPIFRSGLQIQRQIAWWARVGSNHRPYDYQSYALAS